MRIRYALYERTPNGYQWTWRAEELKDSLLDDFYFRIRMLDDASSIGPEHLCGGILKFAQMNGSKLDEHVVLYRFYNGGSDGGGRSRVTMLAAWTTTDQFPAPSGANGVLGLFRNRTFDLVSDKARTIGIEQPYSLFSNEPFPSPVAKSSVALTEFLHGLTDDDHDYLLMIKNDDHELQKTRSAAFKYREDKTAERVREDEQRKAYQMKQEANMANEGKREAAEEAHSAEKMKQERDRLDKEKRLQKQKNRMINIMKFAVSTVTILILVAIFMPRNNSWNWLSFFSDTNTVKDLPEHTPEKDQEPKLSSNVPKVEELKKQPLQIDVKPELSRNAKMVVEGFKNLLLNEQEHVFHELQRLHKHLNSEKVQNPSWPLDPVDSSHK